ncbi:MAG TPA: protein kinase, partial [Gemmataceae bacterium]|nr:protein kinase [Gemmataceae bacterium]
VAGAVGTQIGPYKLLQLIGEGGMGSVWMAEQQQPVRRKVAVKVIKAGMDSDQFLARFEAERQALALMDHPNIATVLDAGTTDRGRPFFVMELVKGVPITKYCDDARLSPRERLDLFVPVCQAVQHAHQKGIIHRDLKPSNVLVALYDGRPVPKVIDFGVAKATGGRLTEKTLFTEFGAVIGTYEYMAPEQAERNQLDVDTRSDVYSLGVLLYELLTGATPFDRKRLRTAAFDEMLRIIREEEPPKPSTRLSGSAELSSVAAVRRTEPAKLSKLVRGDLDWIVMKALEKDRGRRYETANGFARDVQRYLADEPVEAGPPSAAYRLRKLARRYRVALLTAAAFVAVLTAAAVVSAWQAVVATQAKAAAEAARDAEAQQRRRTRAALDDMLSEESLGFLTMQQKLLPQQRAFLGRALKYYQEFAAQAATDEQGQALEAQAQFRVGHIYRSLGQQAEAEDAFRAALALYEKLAAEHAGVPEYCRWLSGCQNNLANLLGQQGRHAEAEAAYRAALAVGERSAAEHPGVAEYRQDVAKSHLNLGVLLSDLGQLLDAEAEYRKALALQERLAAEHPGVPEYRQLLSVSHKNLGTLLYKLRRHVEAEAAYRAALAGGERLAAEYPGMPECKQNLASTHDGLGGLLTDLGRHVEAEAAYRAALAVYEKLAADHPGVPEYRKGLAQSHHNLGRLLRRLGKRSEAEGEYRSALALQEKLSAEFPAIPDYAVRLGGIYCNFGHFMVERGEPAAALDWFAKGLATLEPVHRAYPRAATAQQLLRNGHGSRADALMRLNRPAEALADLDRALELDDGSLRTGLRLGRADALARTGEAAKALAAADELAAAGKLTADQLYELTCVYALTAAKLPPADADRVAARTVATLRQAIAAGFRNIPHLLKDPDLGSLRGRADYAELLWDLADTPPAAKGSAP